VNGTDIKQVLSEIGDLLCESRLDSVYQLDDYTFLLTLFGGRLRGNLLISVKRNAERFHLVFERIHRDYFINTPWVTLLRKHCTRGKIQAIRYVGGLLALRIVRDRTCELIVDFDSNDVLLMNKDGTVCFQLRNGGRGSKSSRKGGEELSYPGGGTLVADEARKELRCNRRLSDEYIRQQNGALARKILSVMRGERKKLGRLLEKLLDEQREVRDKDRYRLQGELLKYNLSRVPRGEQSITLTGFDGEAFTVELDPMLGPRENMDRYFQHYRKLKRREEFIDQKIVFEEKRLGALDELMDLVRKGEAISITRSPVQFVESIDPGVLTRGFQERVRRVFFTEQPSLKDEKKAEAFLRFTSKNGKTMLVGRNARENEELTLRMARGNDLWFHVETGSGSHVILRYDRGGEFQDDDIVDAAMLALYFSHYRNAKSGDIVYTHCKYIRKPKNKPSGYVTYHNNKIKRIHFDERVLQRLLDSRPQGLMLKR
jgi:predicted ribosome quality control (RQC) complex YloA/Tae2 family protein